LVYDGEASTVLELGDDVFVVNSFSKYFNMTGWRLDGSSLQKSTFGRSKSSRRTHSFVLPPRRSTRRSRRFG